MEGPELLVDGLGICNRVATGVFGSAAILCPVYPVLRDERVDSASKNTSSDGVDKVGDGGRRILDPFDPSGVSGSGTDSGR